MAPVLAATKAADDDLGVASYFEVHVRRDERWMIDCASPTAAEALAEAEDIARRGDVTAVKVVNERYNRHTDQSAGRVIFKLEKPERRPRAGHGRLMATARAVPPPPSPTPPAPPALTLAGPAPVAAPPPAELPPAGPSSGLRRAPPAPAAPWLLFAWASLALALGASALFVLLLVIG